MLASDRRETLQQSQCGEGLSVIGICSRFSIGELFEQLLFNLANADGIEEFVAHPK